MLNARLRTLPMLSLMVWTVPLIELALALMSRTVPLIEWARLLIERTDPWMSFTFSSIEWTDELIDLAVSSIPDDSSMIDLVWSSTWLSWPDSGAAARLMLSALWLTLSNSFTESRLWSIGETWLRMKDTRSSMWLAVIRMVTRQATDANAQATMPTRIRSASPFSSLSLLLMAPISA